MARILAIISSKQSLLILGIFNAVSVVCAVAAGDALKAAITAFLSGLAAALVLTDGTFRAICEQNEQMHKMLTDLIADRRKDGAV